MDERKGFICAEHMRNMEPVKYNAIPFLQEPLAAPVYLQIYTSQTIGARWIPIPLSSIRPEIRVYYSLIHIIAALKFLERV